MHQITKLFTFTTLLATLAIPTTTIAAIFPNYYDTLHNGELVATLPITPNNDYIYKTVYSINLNNVTSGDQLDVNVHGEVTNEHNFEVMIAYNIMLCTGLLPSTCFRNLSEKKGYNVTRQMHHGAITDAAKYEFPSNYTSIYVNFIEYSASTDAVANDTLIVNQGAGRMQLFWWVH